MVYQCECRKKFSGARVIAGHKSKCPKITSRTQIIARKGLGPVRSAFGGAKRLQVLGRLHSKEVSNVKGPTLVAATTEPVALDIPFDDPDIDTPAQSHCSSSSPDPQSPSPEPEELISTDPNNFGLFCLYKKLLSVNPEEFKTLPDFCDVPTFSLPPNTSTARSPLSIYGTQAAESLRDAKSKESSSWFTPFMNAMVCHLMNWFYSSTTKTLADLNSLVHNVILAPDFDKVDLHGFNASHEAQHLDSNRGGESTPPTFVPDGWKEDFVTLHLSQTGFSFESEDSAPMLDIHGVWHRPLVDVIIDAFQDPSALDFHVKGFRHMWIRPDGSMERIHGEVYCSDVYLEMEDKITPEPGCDLETVVALMMQQSDSTHLANFGTASLWPAYLGLSLMLKYTQAMPTSFGNHHVAYFPLLPDNIQDVYLATFDKPASSDLLTFLKRELMQKIWALLLDPNFMEAYEHGIIIKCADGIT
ncbi:hypothetical protein EDD18DRAFT_1364490 [Armillaria luteobubalina]|uniref:Uncharacterized protein n=1 Tax=Armillaria luteobubalina TaxID=153913 RepID=A0AA39P856_9AGAR|nr:hypothetical protein EDD18DRAFT_1364490 [Armillaria luteobubalina]